MFRRRGGAASLAQLGPPLAGIGLAGRELILVSGAYCVGYLHRFGLTGTAIGVPLGLAFLPLVDAMPVLAWAATALAGTGRDPTTC